MKIIPFFGVSWESNSYLLIADGQAALIDAGVSVELVRNTLLENGATLSYILLTHGHFDHTISVDALRREWNVPLLIHEKDAEMLLDAEKSALYLFFGTKSAHGAADKILKDGEKIPLGNQWITVIHTPGHSRGSVCYLCEDALFSGDTIFARGYGRYDLHGGDGAVLVRSLQSLRSLDKNLTLYPGHGGASTLQDTLSHLSGMI